MNAYSIYTGSDGNATKALYTHLASLGPAGAIARDLFRAQKASERAKKYSRQFRDQAYQKKQWSIGLLCESLKLHAEQFKIVWGWKQDLTQSFAVWCFYADLPGIGQVSFHCPARGPGPDYLPEWDQQIGVVPQRVIRHVQNLLDSVGATAINSALCEPPPMQP